MKEITKAIHNWIKKNNNKVAFVGSFISFNKEGNVKDDLIVGFGAKGVIKISLDELKDMLKKEKGGFINW